MDWLSAFWSHCDLEAPFKATIGHIKGPYRSYVLTDIATTLRRPLCILCEDTQTASQLEEECRFLRTDPSFPILVFPDYETLPFDHFSPHHSILSDRLSTLSVIPNLEQGIIITTAAALLQRLPPCSFIAANSFSLKEHDTFNAHTFRIQLERAGYRAVQEVLGHGEYAIRGSIIDIFPMGEASPFRLDLFDHEIESIRLLDPDTQRSLQTVSHLRCLPTHEFILNTETITRFQTAWHNQWAERYQDSPVLQGITEGRIPPGIEYYLPLFYTETATLLDYLPISTLLCFMGNTTQHITQYWKTIRDCFHAHQWDAQYPALPPERVFIPEDALHQQFKNHIQITLLTDPIQKPSTLRINAPHQSIPPITIDAKSEQPYHQLQQFIAKNAQSVLLFTADSEGRCSILQEHLRRLGAVIYLPIWNKNTPLKPGLYTTVAPFIDAAWINDINSVGIFIISELLLFAHTTHHRKRSTHKKKLDDVHTFIRDITELQLGDPVVHIEHGVGRYAGLTHIALGAQTEFVTLEYAQEARLYVPISDLSCIARYASTHVETAPLDRLGSDRFSKAKEKAIERIRDVAAELLAIYAARAARSGFAFQKPQHDYQLFAEGFPFELTEDQAKAIDAVITDMKQPKPMDRLLCGDVGFGKTEVALRAAFLCVQSGKQVALLAPTTLLVEQHYETFTNRFANWPVRIESISRFKSKSQLKTVLAATERGEIDILIGTHQLLSPQIHFKQLGLVVIDEEHRFGVRHKEKLKSMRAEVDILTMTATPIPRTLNMAFSELRDLSIIATPPAKRLAIHTFVKESDPALLVEAISREIYRGGQIYYLHNSVDTIYRCQEELQALIPGLKTGVAHGQMRESELSPIMSQFYHNQFQVLICTTIIETGLDVPNANTIIIERADRLGLAQLHQLRGRVGRSNRQAYAYLLVPPWKTLTRDAQKRLEAIQSASELGAGFTLASFDLEIRGAGELLGDEQSGHMHNIGLALYFELLSRTVQAMKEKRPIDMDRLLHQERSQIELHLPALFPETYIQDIPTRLQFYHRLSRAETEETVDTIMAEVIDRFGLAPESAETLFEQTRLRLRIEAMGIQKIEYSHHQIKIKFGPNPNINTLRLIQLVQQSPNLYQLQGQNTLILLKPNPEAKIRIATILKILDQII